MVPAVAGGLPKYPDGGATPALSANGTKDGIVWAIATHTWRGGGPPAVPWQTAGYMWDAA